MVAPTLLGGLVAAAALVPLTQAARPDIKAAPFHPGRAFPSSAPRTKTCAVKPLGNGTDDSGNILKAFKDCNNGGTVVLDQTYNICNPLDLTFLNAVDVALTGTVGFCDDIEHWLPRTFKYNFQGSSAMWVFGGKDVHIYGNGVGTLQGNGANGRGAGRVPITPRSASDNTSLPPSTSPSTTTMDRRTQRPSTKITERYRNDRMVLPSLETMDGHLRIPPKIPSKPR